MLNRQGITETRDTNQIANYALVEWSDNIAISDKSPQEYLPLYVSRVDTGMLKQMYYWHALPENWESYSYDEFLVKRRELMGQVIKDAYHKLN